MLLIAAGEHLPVDLSGGYQCQPVADSIFSTV
jgi:hypothetical protein